MSSAAYFAAAPKFKKQEGRRRTLRLTTRKIVPVDGVAEQVSARMKRARLKRQRQCLKAALVREAELREDSAAVRTRLAPECESVFPPSNRQSVTLRTRASFENAFAFRSQPCDRVPLQQLNVLKAENARLRRHLRVAPRSRGSTLEPSVERSSRCNGGGSSSDSRCSRGDSSLTMCEAVRAQGPLGTTDSPAVGRPTRPVVESPTAGDLLGLPLKQAAQLYSDERWDRMPLSQQML